jgi:ABC-type glycerol-3-phosphate transport system permease component
VFHFLPNSLQRILPPVVVLTPFYILLAESGMIDTWIGLILLYSTFNLSFCVVIASGVHFNFAGVDTILAIAPPVILSLLVQRYLARGLSFGAVKG